MAFKNEKSDSVRSSWAIHTTSGHKYTNSVSSVNNAWFLGECGDHVCALHEGKIAPEKQKVVLPASYKVDCYSTSRNLAAIRGGERYTYAVDCSDELHRDFKLRFATRQKKNSQLFDVLPAVTAAKDKKGSSVKVESKKRLSGLMEPNRFVFCAGKQTKN